MQKTVGFIGLGQMGKWMALNLIKNDFDLTVYDIDAGAMDFLVKQGAGPARNPCDLARRVDAVILSLPNADIVEKVIFGDPGIVQGAGGARIILDCGTTGFLQTTALAVKLEKTGIRLVDAPVTGMEQRAKDASLTIMAGGPRNVVEAVRPLLEAMGSRIVHMGDVGSGQLAKMINNIIFNCNMAALAEVLPMAVRLGLDPEKTARVIRSGSGQSFAADTFIPRILENRFDTGYPLASAYKDMQHAMEISAEKKISLPLVHAAAETYQKALDSGWGGEDKGAMIKVFEKSPGPTFREKTHRQ